MEDDEPRCRVSHPADPHNLVTIRDRKNNSRQVCFSCGKRESDTDYFPRYYCTTCDVEFHEDCHKYPRKIRHPYHLQHPLTLTYRDLETQDDIVFDKCDWCKATLDTRFYRCSICNFCLDYRCSIDAAPLTITNPKCHQHSLHFIPRPLLVPCDACGWVKEGDPSYACFLCNYMVHRYCIDLPRIIKITRHPHRLSHTPCLPLSNPPCRICYKKVDIKYGSYSCNQEDCDYLVHSRCATYGSVWDGEELEWEPEEPDDVEDVEPFKIITDGLIKYFCHQHHLKLDMYDLVRDAERHCQACVLPIDSRHFYNCIHCDDFALHEVCAGLPRKLDHAMHRHRLVLDPSPIDKYQLLRCRACQRGSTGFRYKCSDEYCASSSPFHIDFRCITIAQYLTHKSHEHPLFMVTGYGIFDATILCNYCKKQCCWAHLQCTRCEFAMCFTCATIPQEIFYKFDEHPLTLCYEQDTGHTYWCEVCEKIIKPAEWFYTCNKCCPTIHLECLFGSTICMKPGSSFAFNSAMVEIVRNGNNTRFICAVCRNRCPDSIYFTVDFWFGIGICSFICLEKIVEWYDLQVWHNKRYLENQRDMQDT